ncbi:MAG: GTPase HflX [Bacillota bacterium]
MISKGNPERVVVLAVETTADRLEPEDIAEMERLVESAGGVVVHTAIQRRQSRDPGFLVGKGKIHELAGVLEALETEMVVVACDLSAAQARNIEAALGAKVIDRTQLIMDIFAQRAQTREGKLQVELAQLLYLLPRLSGKGVALSRLGGGIGTRGPGETKLEADRRTIRRRIADLNAEIEAVGRHRSLHRRSRRSVPLPVCALVGYTNAGKSSLLRALTGAQVVVEDRLFATLDPTTRKVALPNRQELLLTDTVGFIRHLPPHLVAAFRATLEEVIEADLLVHVVDVSDQGLERQVAAVNEILESLGVHGKPMVTALNKIDLLDGGIMREALIGQFPNAVAVSALTGQGFEGLLEAFQRLLAPSRVTIRLRIPYGNGDVLSTIRRGGVVHEEVYHDDCVEILAEIDRVLADRMEMRLGEGQCERGAVASMDEGLRHKRAVD